MHLHYGIKTIQRPLGYVAEKCPFCSKVTVCRLFEVARAEHVYGLATSNTVCVDHEAKCRVCSRGFSVYGYHYHALSRNRKAAVDELLPLTSPWLVPGRKSDAEQESRFRKLLQPFITYDIAYRSRGLDKRMQVDWVGGLSFLLGLVLPFGVFALIATGVIPLSRAQGVGFSLILGFVTVPWGAYMFMGENRRFFRRSMVPEIGKAIAPLHPQWSEMEAAIHRLRIFKCPTASLLSPELVQRALIQRARAKRWNPGE